MENKQNLIYIIIKDRSFNKFNEERKKYQSNHYGLGYTLLCNSLGIEPEDQLLYEHGLAELMKKKF